MSELLSPYRGQHNDLPQGWMEAATAPGRNFQAAANQIIGAVADVSKAYEARIQEHKRDRQLGKAAHTFYSTLSQEEQPIPPEEFANLSSRDKIDMVQGMFQAQAYKKATQDLAAQVANTAARNRQTAYDSSTEDARRSMLEGESESIRAANARAASLKERTDNLTGQLRDRFNPEFIGPKPPLDGQAVMQMLGSSGLLMDPQADNLLTAVTKMQPPPRGGAPGTVTKVPGTGYSFGWQTPNSGTWIPDAKVALEPTPAPDGFALVKDTAGDAHYLRLPENKTPPDPLVPRLQNVLENLRSLRAKGAKHAKVSDDYVVTEPGTLGRMFATPIDELIQKYQNNLDSINRSSRATPSGTAPSPQRDASTFDEFQRWKQGRQ